MLLDGSYNFRPHATVDAHDVRSHALDARLVQLPLTCC